MPHSSTERPFTPPPGYSIVDRRGCFCRPGEPGSLSPVIFVTFESLLPSNPATPSSFLRRKGRKGEGNRGKIIIPLLGIPTARVIFPMLYYVSCLIHPAFSNILLFTFSRYISEGSRKFPSFIPLNFCSTFVVAKLLIQKMQCLETANNFSARMAPYIPFS